ncbi:MAG: hypothetical protein OXG53_17840, partial [Chloroflexi bacterium]|nr:hypothetical protein [Chloroflexota bacterium]
MLRPELTPIDSGDKPEKPKPEDLTNSPFRDFGNPPPPPSPPSSQPPPPPPGGDQPSQSVHDHGDQPGLKSSGQSSSSKSDEQGSKGSSQAEDTDDADRGKDETGAKDELPDFEEAEENRIDPADILKFYLAAQHNPVLREIRFLTEHEGIPVMLQGNIDA